MTNNARDKRYNYYWGKFEEHLKNKGLKLPMSNLKGRRNGRAFFKASEGLTIFAIPSLGKMNEKDKTKCSVEVLIEYPDSFSNKNSNIDYNREAFKQLKNDEPVIKDGFDGNLELNWLDYGENKKAKRAKISCIKYFDSNQEEDWHEHYPWFIETIKSFDRVFTHRLEKIKL